MPSFILSPIIYDPHVKSLAYKVLYKKDYDSIKYLLIDKKLFLSKMNWKEKIIGYLGWCIKTKIRQNINSNSSPPYQMYTPWNMILKVDHHTRAKWFIHGPQHHKKNQLLSLKHSWLSLV